MNMYFDVILKKNPVFIFENPSPAHILLHILPTPTFHQNTNRGLRKRIRVFFFHLKYYQTLNPVCTFNRYHKRIFDLTKTILY